MRRAGRTRRALLERAAGEDMGLVPTHLRAASMQVREAGGGFFPVIES